MVLPHELNFQQIIQLPRLGPQTFADSLQSRWRARNRRREAFTYRQLEPKVLLAGDFKGMYRHVLYIFVIVYIYMHIYTEKNTFLYIYIYIYQYVYCVYTYIYIYIHICVYIYIIRNYSYSYIYIYTYIYIYIYIYICIFVYMYKYINICIYIYIYVWNLDGTLVPPKDRAETIATNLERKHWSNLDIHEIKRNDAIHALQREFSTERVTFEEYESALRTTKNSKQAGPDGLMMELFKWMDSNNRTWILNLISHWWVPQVCARRCLCCKGCINLQKGKHRPARKLSTYLIIELCL